MTTKKLILQPKKECFFCGTTVGLHRHHVFGGPNRKHSEDFGCVVYLCGDHHNLSNKGVHLNKHMDLLVKRYAQKVFEETYSHEEFMKIFHKNYLGGDDDGI